MVKVGKFEGRREIIEDDEGNTEYCVIAKEKRRLIKDEDGKTWDAIVRRDIWYSEDEKKDIIEAIQKT